MKNCMRFIAILFTISFTLIACSDIEQEKHSSNNQEKNVDVREKSFTVIEDEKKDLITKEIEKEELISDDAIEKIVENSYKEIGGPGNSGVYEIYDNTYEEMDIMKFMDFGVDRDNVFFKEVYDLLYPELSGFVTSEGMEAIIDSEFLSIRHHKNPTILWPDYDRLEIIEKSDTYFKVKQISKVFYYDHVKNEESVYEIEFIVEFIKEDNDWKLNGAETI